MLEKVKSKLLDPARPAQPLTPRESARQRGEEYVASRGLDSPVGTMSNLSARRAYNTTLENKVKDLSQTAEASAVVARKAEKKAEVFKAEADERFRELVAQREQLQGEKAALTEALAVLQAEKKGEAELAAQARRSLEERVAALEATLRDERTAGQGKLSVAEEQKKAAVKERDGALAEARSLQERLHEVTSAKTAAEEQGARLETQLIATRAERRCAAPIGHLRCASTLTSSLTSSRTPLPAADSHRGR